MEPVNELQEQLTTLAEQLHTLEISTKILIKDLEILKNSPRCTNPRVLTELIKTTQGYKRIEDTLQKMQQEQTKLKHALKFINKEEI